MAENTELAICLEEISKIVKVANFIMSAYTSLIFNNVPFITPHLESQYLSEKVISAAVAIHDPHFKSGIVLEHVGLLVTTDSNHTFLIHSCPVPPTY
ncbi:15730_t:CDS:2, partial [Dentiscutata heterogama]